MTRHAPHVLALLALGQLAACAASSSAAPTQYATTAPPPSASAADTPPASTTNASAQPAAPSSAATTPALATGSPSGEGERASTTAASATPPATDAARPNATHGAATAPARGNAPARQLTPEEQFPPVAAEPERIAVEARHPDPARPDPLHGRFTIAQASAGLPPGSDLVADIQTSMGSFTCTLAAAEAPITVANFVGLARGLRDFWDPVAGRWTRRPFYDGSAFHRVIPGFMVQGGDILRSGRGGPGYEIRDENVTGHTAPGLLCMANHGPNTGGAQFFITEVPLPRLDGSYSIFGRCTPTDLVERIARVPRSAHDQPIAPVRITHIDVHRPAPP